MLTEEKANEFLIELIRMPGASAADIPQAFAALVVAHRAAFPAAVEPSPVKKRRRGPKNPNIGWPAGVKREEYKAWKDTQTAKGQTENINPQEYKRQRDAGEVA
jgi:hypothetical protein